MSLSTTDALKALADMQKRVNFSDKAHRYYVQGKSYPSVTTVQRVLSAPALEAWKIRVQVAGTAKAAYANPPLQNEPVDAYAARMALLAAEGMEHERISKEAADDGTQTHQLIEWRLRRMMGQDLPRPKVSEAAAFREAGWEHWAKDVRLKPLAVEARLYHDDLMYCGTLDLLAEIEGVTCVADWKKSPRVYESHHIQGVAYRMALERIGFARMPGYVVLMPEGQQIDRVELDDSDSTRAAWLSCLQLFRWQKGFRK